MMSQLEDFRRQAPPPLSLRPMQIPTAHETKLSNGLTLVIVEDKRLPLVSYRLAFRTGDAHDPKGLPGLTDMMSGLLTEGTESRTSRQIAEEVERMGATLHAGASSDYTTISASALTPFGDKILELMADVVLRPSFPENEVELTKQNTKESLKQQRAQPSFLASETVSRVMFGEHPYSLITPTPESIDATARERLVEFHRSAFVPNNAVFVVGGDVEFGAIVASIEKLFGSWQGAEARKDDFPAPPARFGRSAYLVDRPGSAQSNIVIANIGITRTSSDYFPMLLMHTVLGANASSRLFMNLREEKGYTYGAYSSLDARRTAGTFRATAEVRTPVTGDSLKEFFYELERIRTEPVSEKEIADAKSYLTGVFPIRLETQEGLIDQLVQIRMLGLADEYLHTYREQVQAVTIDQIQDVAQKYVKPDEAAIVIVGDGAQVIEQLKPYAQEIEIYNTAGKRKEAPAGASAASGSEGGPASLAGTWAIEIETPFGQSIPATLTLVSEGDGFSGKIDSEMGEGELADIILDGQQFQATLSFDMGGQVVAAQITGTVDNQQICGSVSLQNSPPLPFTGHRAE
jgi:zinc protease